MDEKYLNTYVTILDNKGKAKDHTICDNETIISIPSDAQKLIFKLPAQGDIYRFDLHSITIKRKEKKIIFDSYYYAKLSGYLYFNNCDRSLLCELWPCMEYPYLESVLTPNLEKKLKIKNKNNFIEAACYLENGIITRNYILKNNLVEIHTKYNGLIKNKYSPLFHFSVLDSKVVFNKTTVTGKVISYYSFDNNNVYPDLIFEDFKNEDNDMVKSAEVLFDEKRYLIYSSEAFYCNINMNYIAIRFEQSKVKDNVVVFPKIIIEEFEIVNG